ncbi:uncharacterized protein LOC128440739 [Xyrichtys novacula]|uniref:Uncharacterized protein LOC128440739 n=1 Tax=Xyrichtys novacula TaxID=13765 RepID=A0AAV1FA15_XYRNO|nr:uncharacterized protein LOC128440739 [Xyrichtys novacula]
MDIRKWFQHNHASKSDNGGRGETETRSQLELCEAGVAAAAGEQVVASSGCSLLPEPLPPQPPLPSPQGPEQAPGPPDDLAMMDYTLKKDKDFKKIFETIPANAKYTSNHIQNEIIELMSKIITEEIVNEIGDVWYTLKVDGTKDPTGCENISIVLRFVDKSDNSVKERLISMPTSKHCDAKSLTQLVLSHLEDIGLNTGKILSQCYDGASVMSGVNGGMQKLIQEELQREVPYVHCFNHQLHLVVVNAMSSDNKLENFFGVCNSLYKFFRKPTVAAVYTGEKLKRLLEQRWTGHLATVKVIMNSCDDIVHLLQEIEGIPTIGADVRIEATGLLKAITEPSFPFIACMTHQILGLLDPPNTALQAKSTDLYTGVRLVQSALECVEELRSDSQFDALWEKCTKEREMTEPSAATPSQSKRRREKMTSHLKDFVVETPFGHRHKEVGEKTECKRLYFSTLDAVVGEMTARFNERNSQLVQALCAVHPESEHFMDVNKVKPLLDLTGINAKEAEFTVAKHFLKDEMAKSDKNKSWTTQDILKTYSMSLAAMPTVIETLKLSLTFGASTATCENSFSMLKNVFSEHRRSMLHERKVHLIQIAVEKDLTQKIIGEWREKLLRRFNTSSRRLQLY